jgi:molecular chaperone HtpG
LPDNGIGMSREEVIANIGTIAKSGTKEFLATLTGDQQKDARLDRPVRRRVLLLVHRRGPRHAGHPPGRAAGRGGRALGSPTGRANIRSSRPSGRARGTEVTLHLREGEDELLEPWRVKAIVRKYSDHIGLPIVLAGESKVDPVTKEFMAGKEETLNQASALWARPKPRSPTSSTGEFYKHVAHDFERPAGVGACARRGPADLSPSCSTFRRGRRSTCGIGKRATACGCTSSASSSWRTART